jgi:hypothetical protein
MSARALRENGAERRFGSPMLAPLDTGAVTYCGLADDFAQRHRRGIKTLRDLNDQLLAAVLFGDPLLVNDGYVVMHPAIRAAVLKPSSSPFRKLAEEGYVKILSRQGEDADLGSLVPLMVSQGITSAVSFASDARALKEFTEWSNRLKGAAEPRFKPWPKYDSTAIFRKIVAEAHKAAVAMHADLAAELTTFDAAVRETKGRRTEWETTARRLSGEGKLSSKTERILMQVADEAYQYSWGCALSDGKRAVRVQTHTPTFVGLDLPVGEVTTERREPVEIAVPNLEIARKRVRGGEAWALLAELSRPSDISAAKRGYMEKLRRYYTVDDCGREEMKRAADEYSAALSDHFKTDKLPKAVFTYGFPIAAGAAAFALTGPVGTIPAAVLGVAIAVGGTKGDALGGRQLLMRLSRQHHDHWVELEKPSIANTRSSFDVDPARAARVLREIPLFAA